MFGMPKFSIIEIMETKFRLKLNNFIETFTCNQALELICSDFPSCQKDYMTIYRFYDI